MSGFSPEWLALREPVDHRSRDPGLAAELTRRFAGRESVSVIDLGCGTGSNLRATSRLLPAQQSWVLVDYDPALLAAARGRLTAWADSATATRDGVDLAKGDQRIAVAFRPADLMADLDRALAGTPDLVTASALFDLASVAFIQRFAKAVAAKRAAFYTVLTYNGGQTWTPGHENDMPMAYAFHAHQQTDKGFGPAAGPDAPDALVKGFKAAGYEVTEGDSPWRLDAGDAVLVGDLAAGFANAIEETRRVDAATLASWRKVERTGAVVGHTDTLALPPHATG